MSEDIKSFGYAETILRQIRTLEESNKSLLTRIQDRYIGNQDATRLAECIGKHSNMIEELAGKLQLFLHPGRPKAAKDGKRKVEMEAEVK